MNTPAISPRRRRDIIDALRRGTVPQRGLDVMAVGLDRFAAALDDELDAVSQGSAHFKALRGEYGSGKTFFSRWLTESAKKKGFATVEIQVSETEAPLHKLEKVYRRIVEDLETPTTTKGAFRDIIDGWFYLLDKSIAASGDETSETIDEQIDKLLEQRLAKVSQGAPMFAQALRGYRRLTQEGNRSDAEGILAWLGGQPQVAAQAKREAGVRGDLDAVGALSFLQGLLTVLRDSDYSGLVLVLDEVETLQRVRSDVREKALNGLRQLMDEIDAGRFPGLYLLVTGTPAFFDGQQGVQRLAPLAQRLQTDFGDPRWDNPRAVQIRLQGFTGDALVELGLRVRDIYASGAQNPERITSLVDDSYVQILAEAVSGELGGKAGVAPRLFLKKLIADVLDRVDQFPDFDPRQHYRLTIASSEMDVAEADARALGDRRPADTIDDIDLDVDLDLDASL